MPHGVDMWNAERRRRIRDGHVLGPSMGWVGSNDTAMGWVQRPHAFILARLLVAKLCILHEERLTDKRN